MSEPNKKSSQSRLGCLVSVILAVALVVGGGLYLGLREDATKTPCERYARVYMGQLHNCHSGVTQNPAHHIGMCELYVDPSEACIDKVKGMTCEQLEAGPPISAPQECGKAP